MHYNSSFTIIHTNLRISIVQDVHVYLLLGNEKVLNITYDLIMIRLIFVYFGQM